MGAVLATGGSLVCDQKMSRAVAGRFCVGVILLSVLTAACEPVDRRPGTWLSGDVVEIPGDWSVTATEMEIFVETSPWWGVPHSVTTVVAASGEHLYVPSIYEQAAVFPGTKRWNKNIAADPDVRLKIGELLYELKAVPVLDPAEFDVGFRALADKYPFWRTALEDKSKRPHFAIIRMEPR